ncbi:MAG: FKBP-type peptidyl-prolyl cis-trans isomerase [Saprospiraceae bacterium]|jgi:FKBP-type peptidyl-prolyl cis-trans isomerase
MKHISIVTLFLGVLMIMACSPNSDAIFEEQATAIDEYVAAKGWTDTTEIIRNNTHTGIVFYLEEAGNGVEYPTENATVTVHYEGRLLDDSKFDSSFDRGQPSTFPLSNVISGWTWGIPKFRKGDKGYLIIPSKYAYGSQARTGIPKNSVLVFYIEMIDFD